VEGTEAEKLVKGILGGGKTDSAAAQSDTAKTASEAIKQKVQEEAKDKIKNLLKRR